MEHINFEELDKELEERMNPPKSEFQKLYKNNLEDEKYKEDIEEDEPENYLPVPVFWDQLDKEEFPEQSWRINKLIPKEGFVILASISGNKKSWIAMEMAKSISSGENFLNKEEFKTEGANVLYLNAENPKSEIQRRGWQLGFRSNNYFNLHIVNSEEINLNKPEGYVWLKTFVGFHKIKVVFIDTFIAVTGGLKEEKAEEIRQFFNKFNSLKNSGVTIVWLMHLRKPNNFEGKTPKKEQLLGSQDKSASVEVLLMLHSDVDDINVYQRKNRLGREIEPFKVNMIDTKDDKGCVRTRFEYGGLLDDSDCKKDEAKEMIIDILESGGKNTGEILTLVTKQVGSKNTRTALNELVKEEIINVSKQGKSNYYVLIQNNQENKEIDSSLI